MSIRPTTKHDFTNNNPSQTGLIPEDGWIPVTDSWSYASASTINIPSDGTTRYQKGYTVRFKQGGGYKYFAISNPAATLLTVFVNGDFTVANSAITDIAYSPLSAPFGFPEWFNFTPASFANCTLTTNTNCRYKVMGREVTWEAYLTVTMTSNNYIRMSPPYPPQYDDGFNVTNAVAGVFDIGFSQFAASWGGDIGIWRTPQAAVFANGTSPIILFSLVYGY